MWFKGSKSYTLKQKYLQFLDNLACQETNGKGEFGVSALLRIPAAASSLKFHLNFLILNAWSQ